MLDKKQLIFWIVIWVFLTLLFALSLESVTISFYFVTTLMPVVIGTSAFFNHFLVPRYLLQERRLLFGLYLTYMIIVSIYLELIVMVLAFVILADYQIGNLGKIASDIYLLTIILYLIVMIEGMILTLRKLKEKGKRLSEVEAKFQNEQKEGIEIKENRKKVLIPLEEIVFVESLGDYVRIHAKSGIRTTREKISSFEERLPSSFIRIHRSFIVNKSSVNSFSKEEVLIGDSKLTIGRKYKKSFEEAMKVSITA